jgi:hypothetical protein
VSWTLPFDVLRLGLASVGRNISRSLKLLCLKRNIGNLSAIQEKIGYLLRQRGNERFVGNPESAGINRHVVGDERALQERRQRIHPGLESCRRYREVSLEA